MTPATLSYIRARARDGNRPLSQKMATGLDAPPGVFVCKYRHPGSDMVLSETGLLIARLADALDVAGEVVENYNVVVKQALGAKVDGHHAEVVRRHCAELLGNE